MSKSYKELCKLKSFKERLEYLKVDGVVGEDVFGSRRIIGQQIYKSKQYRDLRRDIIVRDDGCEFGLPEYPILGRVIVHHINPIQPNDLENNLYKFFDPNNLVCVSHDVHNAIHFGDVDTVKQDIVERKPNDTSPWKKEDI